MQKKQYLAKAIFTSCHAKKDVPSNLFLKADHEYEELMRINKGQTN